MKRLPPLLKSESLETRIALVERWQVERELDLQSRKAEFEEEALNSEIGGFHPQFKPVDSEPALVGEIRLLHPDLVPGQSEPLYLAVISEWRPIGVLVTPFSRYNAPASEGEFLTQKVRGPLHTLSTWNSLTLSREALERSWVIDQLSEAECREARAHFRFLNLGEELPPELESRIGVSSSVHAEFRDDYYQEEQKRLAPVTALQDFSALWELSVKPLIEKAERTIEEPSIWSEAPPLAMAAGGDEDIQHAVWVMNSDAKESRPQEYLTALADESFIFYPDQQEVPTVQWELLGGVREDLANARVLLTHKELQKCVATGRVDTSGTYITLEHLCEYTFMEPRLATEEWVLMVYPV